MPGGVELIMLHHFSDSGSIHGLQEQVTVFRPDRGLLSRPRYEIEKAIDR